jgi:hypothetical protein
MILDTVPQYVNFGHGFLGRDALAVHSKRGRDSDEREKLMFPVKV